MIYIGPKIGSTTFNVYTVIVLCESNIVHIISTSHPGGSVIFDEADITLNSEYILVMDDGLLQIGTHEEPFQHKATIMMHGHVRSKELPIYGAKTLAVRHGTLDLHGKSIFLVDRENAIYEAPKLNKYNIYKF